MDTIAIYSKTKRQSRELIEKVDTNNSFAEEKNTFQKKKWNKSGYKRIKTKILMIHITACLGKHKSLYSVLEQTIMDWAAIYSTNSKLVNLTSVLVVKIVRQLNMFYKDVQNIQPQGLVSGPFRGICPINSMAIQTSYVHCKIRTVWWRMQRRRIVLKKILISLIFCNS